MSTLPMTQRPRATTGRRSPAICGRPPVQRARCLRRKTAAGRASNRRRACRSVFRIRVTTGRRFVARKNHRRAPAVPPRPFGTVAGRASIHSRAGRACPSHTRRLHANPNRTPRKLARDRAMDLAAAPVRSVATASVRLARTTSRAPVIAARPVQRARVSRSVETAFANPAKITPPARVIAARRPPMAHARRSAAMVSAKKARRAPASARRFR